MLEKNREIIYSIEKNIVYLFKNNKYNQVVQNCLILLDISKNNKIGIKYLELSKKELGGDYWEKTFESIYDFWLFSG
ncbi:MAG: hypothetical protein Q9M94_07795 [Candidatus Gracilibacteria bacterium]|nr:hypothetical protein [Candidatus Gracilibacteria bacterium]